jgi:hypothetical protein
MSQPPRIARTFARALLAGLLLLAPLLAVSKAQAQQAAVQGIVTDATTAQALAGATVLVERAGQAARSVLTDKDGLYQISGVAPGAYKLHISYFGYAAHEEAIELAGGQRLTANRGLAPDPLQLQGVSFATPAGGAVERDLGRQIITARDLGRIPTPAANGDLVSYLQTLPGVISTGDRGGQLLVRGGTPAENMVLMDGLILYQPYHITGFFSAFPEDLVASAEFYPGGFGARYSGRVSSVLDVRMRDGDRNQGSIAGSTSPFLTEVTAEGPLLSKGGGYSMIASARRSTIEQTSSWLLGEKLPLRFSSYYLKLSSVARDGSSRCSMTSMQSHDWGGLDPKDETSRVEWTNFALGGRCANLAGDYFIDARFGYSYLGSKAVTHGLSEFSSNASRLDMEANLSRSAGPVQLALGAFTRLEDTSYGATEFLSRKAQSEWMTALGVYGEATLRIGDRFRVLPGAALTWSPDTTLVTFEPRLRASWHPLGRAQEELSVAAGIYRQEIAGITDRRDASSIFTFWTQAPAGARIRAVHAQASWQQRLGAGFSWSLDGFYRRIENLPVTTWSPIATFNTQLSLADGHVRGLDTRIDLRRGPLYAFVGYGNSRTEYVSAQDAFGVWFGDPVISYHPGHDRRHQVNALASVDLGRFQVAVRWEYGSGFPYTRPFGFDEQFDFRTSLPNIIQSFGQTRVLLSRPFNGRLPAVHHLDFSMERTFDLWSRSVQLQAGVINAYDHRNIFYYDVFAGRRIDQLPFAPYASLKLDTRRIRR